MMRFFQSLLLAITFLISVGFSPFYQNKKSNVVDLRKFERSVHSQNGEDGVIRKIFDCIEAPTKYFVEFGASDGFFLSNTLLLREHGWKGLLLDSEFDNPGLNLHKEFITAENINQLFEKYEVPFEFDLLSIDIDFNDFHVWNALNEKYKPRVVVVEYNGNFSPTEDKVVKYNPKHRWDYTNYFGASIRAFYHLARKKGYSLVYAESWGVNLFFVRDDLIQNSPYKFLNVNNVDKLAVQMTWHRQDPYYRPYVSSLSLIRP